MNTGPEIGTQLPLLQAEDIFGRRVHAVDQGRTRLLLFMSPTCGACAATALMRTLARAHHLLGRATGWGLLSLAAVVVAGALR